MRCLSVVTFLFWSALCDAISAPVEPITDFEVDRYLGRWYEIARLENSFESGLENITAEYSLREDGGLAVLNRGYSDKKGKWKDAKGKAYFVKDPDTGFLKVTFFWPFYGAYIIFGLDKKEYQYSFVAGPDTSYLWLLSRTPRPDQAVIDTFIDSAKEHGFDTDKLIFVDHTGSPD